MPRKTVVSPLVRLHGITKSILIMQLGKVNKARLAKSKPPLTQGEFVALSIEHFDPKIAIEER